MQTFYFTFGSDQHPTRNAYVAIDAPGEEAARSIMFALYGREWCACYDQSDFDRVASRHTMARVRTVVIEDEA